MLTPKQKIKTVSHGQKSFVYFFGDGKSDGDASMKNLLGGKGANLAEMTRLGLPVPPGFTLTTEACNYYYEHNHAYPPGLEDQIKTALERVEGIMGARFGDPEKPLLVSCRSGARSSMPGMMDTILNLGLNERTLEGLIRKTGNERFAWDSYRRLIQMYGDTVMGLKPANKKERDPFEKIIEELKREKGVNLDIELSAGDLRELTGRFKTLIRARTGSEFPEDPRRQLWGAIGAVFGSWMNDRARVYRRQYGIPHDWGTAANIQTMVFGNMGDNSASGVAFTRDPATGEKVLFGEYLANAQGEDVVAGIRTPKKISELKNELPRVFQELEKACAVLEKRYQDVQDVEFTVQEGRLWMLQTRTGKRTGFAAVRIAVEMAEEGLVTPETALLQLDPNSLQQLMTSVFDPKSKQEAVAQGNLLGKGINAGPGAASGRICFHADEAETLAQKGEKVILVRHETSPEDIRGMAAAQGILTAMGGASSHAALVSRQMGKVCVTGCSNLEVNYAEGTLTANGRVLNAGDWISLDGFTGEVLSGKLETKPSELVQVLIQRTLAPEDSPLFLKFQRLMSWADRARTLGVRANADLPDQAAAAVALGAEGIGLTRTEHMFFQDSRITTMRRMILAEEPEARRRALSDLLPLQRQDFEGIFRAMQGRPVTIRTFDPPLHEFLPKTPEEQRELAKELKISPEHIARRVEELKEFNPMLGFRGCRLGIVYPEITEMQCRAILEAACVVARQGIMVKPEIMIPLVGFAKEFQSQAALVHETAKKVFDEQEVCVPYLVGTMIEIPRACVAADEIAKTAQFFSFGTNDLTQTVLGMSRDDYSTYIHHYLEHDLIRKDPFQSVDREGVGALMKIAVEKGRTASPKLKIGICGEQGGDPESVEFCHALGLNYVSCSPLRIPIARLAAAQAALRKTL